MMKGRFEGKVCVVNGAASAIGRAVAERLAAEGGTVAGVDVLEHDAGETSLRADLSDEEQVITAYADIHSRHGRIDVIYNNTGQMDPQDTSALNLDVDTWQRVLSANLLSTFLSCKHGIPYLTRNDGPNRGAVVNAASFLGEIGSATAPMAYSAAKAGVIQLTRDLGVHLARRGVRVNAVCFGPIATASQQAIFDRTPGSLERRIVHWPMGRFGTVAEAAGTVAFLASDDSGFITAAALPLDGGITTAFTVADD